MKVYTTEDLAEILQIEIRSVYKLLRSGELKGKKVASKWRVTENQLKEYLEGDE